MVSEERRGLSEQLDELISLQKNGRKEKDKQFRLPFKVKSGINTKIKKNYCMVIVIDDNGSIDFKMLPIENNMIYIKEKGTYHMATSDYILRYKNYPVIIQPTFDSEPFSIKDRFKEANLEGRLTTWQKYYINVMNLSALKPKMEFNKQIIFMLVIGAIVAIGFIVARSKGVI